MLPVRSAIADSAWSTLLDIQRNLNRLLNERFPFGGRMWDFGRAWESGERWVPAMDIVETDDEYRVQLEVPGVAPEEIEVRVDGNTLTVSGEKRYSSGEERRGEGYTFVERAYGRFARSLRLPRTVDAERITARYDRGVLTLVVPKNGTSQSRRIPVTVAPEGREIESGEER